ncbi:hypothetical protein [Mycobacteroides abscessus]|uniref:hypothetical protein n=1 Tax=Mycobacteroides abscessus TaxID=36809 RepID=UPI0009279DE6|nr:hypothetical protein [Mycobacteroides abscessus]MBE5451781.1 hypothetical protein [Mycobacteroides abscessus]MDO3213416.1 hypothetical protein [Mycobacteroides abscessus subsp. abscessus]MDO3233201.1 hypothetical protein [Mycobacteroides abscessus subsp. abscessus]SHV98687.1 Uncharacterised protein [Mycobacteroides abscessus subsp. abscessus]SHX65818.1 Uncharacterised protein [Mycobacteroides abscessus subsp. abscessus]
MNTKAPASDRIVVMPPTEGDTSVDNFDWVTAVGEHPDTDITDSCAAFEFLGVATDLTEGQLEEANAKLVRLGFFEPLGGHMSRFVIPTAPAPEGPTEWLDAIAAHPDLDGDHRAIAACIAGGRPVCIHNRAGRRCTVVVEDGLSDYEPCPNCSLVDELVETGFLIDDAPWDSDLMAYRVHVPNPMIRTYWRFGEQTS